MTLPEPRLSKLYQEVILDHNHRPRNFKVLTNATQYSHGVNPLCGDDYHLTLLIDQDGVIQDVGFEGAGCAISKASSSMMTSLIKGKATAEAARLRENFLKMMTEDSVPATVKEATGRMIIFEGVKEFPVRVKCATLIWQALGDALKDVRVSASPSKP